MSKVLNIFSKRENFIPFKPDQIYLGSIEVDYLRKFIDPEKKYSIKFWISEDQKNAGATLCKGSELTDNDVIELFINKIL